MTKKNLKVHTILTGGTIGSAVDASGALNLRGSGPVTSTETKAGGASLSRKNGILTTKAAALGAEMQLSSPYAILSENLMPGHWNSLITHIRGIDLHGIDALLITHGTDTLAWTASLLSLLMHGLNIPVYLLSSMRPLISEAVDKAETDGLTNLLKTVFDSIRAGAAHGVWVPVEDATGGIRIVKGEKLRPAGDLSDAFSFIENDAVNHPEALLNRLFQAALSDSISIVPEPASFTKNPEIFTELGKSPLIQTVSPLKAHILTIRPYPGIDYRDYDIAHADAILHGCYHSCTAPDGTDGTGSLIRFAERTKKQGKEIFLAPLLLNPGKIYATTRHLLDSGLFTPLWDISFEMAYIWLHIRLALLQAQSAKPH